MPLRYKKMIWFFTMAIMLIGMGTFSLLAPEINFSLKSSAKDSDSAAEEALKGKSEKEIEEELNTLVKGYFAAKQEADMDQMGKYVSDVSHIDEKKLVAEAEYIESYNNISCTILDGAEKASYRIYVYHEDKYYGIDAMIPSLTALYVKAVPGGRFAIYTGTLSADEQKKIEELDKSKKVTKLQDQVNQQLDALISTDPQVKEFYEMLESSSAMHEESAEGIAGEAGSAAGATKNPASPAPQASAPQASATAAASQTPPAQASTAPTQ